MEAQTAQRDFLLFLFFIFVFSLPLFFFSRSVTEFRMGNRKREQNPSKSCLFVERPSGQSAVWYKGGWLAGWALGFPPNIVYCIVKGPSLVRAWVLPDKASEYMHSHTNTGSLISQRMCVYVPLALLVGALHAVDNPVHCRIK